MSLTSVHGVITGLPCQRAVVAHLTNKLAAKEVTTSFQRAWMALNGPLKKFFTALRHRRELEQLARFGDRELRDLAVTRNDIDFALAEPLWRDPATSFTQARSERAGTIGGS